MNWLQIVWSLLLIIGYAESPLKSQMKVPNDPIESKMYITTERQSVLLINPLYKAIHMDALTITSHFLLVTLNDFHHFL